MQKKYKFSKQVDQKADQPKLIKQAEQQINQQVDQIKFDQTC